MLIFFFIVFTVFYPVLWLSLIVEQKRHHALIAHPTFLMLSALILMFGITPSPAPDAVGLALELAAAGVGLFASGVLVARILSPSWLTAFQKDRVLWSRFIQIVLVIWTTTLGFAYLSSYLLWVGAIHTQGHLSEATRLHDLPWSTFRFLVWNLADALPVLNVTKTLNWVNPYQFSNALGGALLLIYKIAVALPVLQLLRLLLSPGLPVEGTNQSETKNVAESAAVKVSDSYRIRLRRKLQSIIDYFKEVAG
jgi:hypothetical protein